MLKVFVGCSVGDDAESCAVLEHTLRKQASAPVDLTWLHLSRTPGDLGHGWNVRGWSTPFTGLRWAIPELCGFKGRAIYMDSDVIVLGDIAELLGAEIPDGAFALVRGSGRKMRTCVMLLDCERARQHLPPMFRLKPMQDQHGVITARLNASPELTGQLPAAWNCVDLKGWEIDDPALRLIHYSSIAHQPSTRHAVARLAKRGRRHWYDGERFDHWRPELIELFDRMLAEAIAAGYPPERYEPAKPYGRYGIRSYRGVRVKGYSP